MISKITEQLREAIKDRQLATMLSLVIVSCLVFIMYVVTNLQYRDTPVVTHYTSYGTQHLYDSSWFEVVSFAGFALVVMIGHVILMIKLNNSKDKNAAFVLFLGTIAIVTIAFIIAYQVLRVAVL